jgi:hypothetical protein
MATTSDCVDRAAALCSATLVKNATLKVAPILEPHKEQLNADMVAFRLTAGMAAQGPS